MAKKKPAVRKTSPATRRGTAKPSGTPTRARQSRRPQFTLHIISDATGSLASHLINVILTQFPDVEIKQVYHTFQDSHEKIRESVRSFGDKHQIVLHSLTDPELKSLIREECVQRRIPHFDLTGSLVQFISDHIGVLPADELWRLHRVDAGYFHRIEAMEFTAQHDDSRGLESLDEADIVLVGLSRLSKSPTATYLGSLGYKTANVSLVAETEPPTELRRVKDRIVALTMQPKRLHEIRADRLQHLGVEESDYADLREVTRELAWANALFRNVGYPLIDVTDLTIEKTASMIIKTLDLPMPGEQDRPRRPRRR
jgi:regulator of PEP synthase PpsR (kinase-PPPase family)